MLAYFHSGVTTTADYSQECPEFLLAIHSLKLLSFLLGWFWTVSASVHLDNLVGPSIVLPTLGHLAAYPCHHCIGFTERCLLPLKTFPYEIVNGYFSIENFSRVLVVAYPRYYSPFLMLLGALKLMKGYSVGESELVICTKSEAWSIKMSIVE